jgi:hypothetical protein
MTVTLEVVVAAVQTLALTVSGVKEAPSSIPSKVDAKVTVIAYPESGVVGSNSAGFATELHIIAVDLIVPGSDYRQTYAFGSPILAALLRKFTENPTLSGTVQTYDNLTYSFDRNALVWTIKINGVKILHTW